MAEACGQLAPFLSAQIRQSLLLGMLGQLADDRKPSVRASAAANLALILPGLEDKYEQVRLASFDTEAVGVAGDSNLERKAREEGEEAGQGRLLG